MPLKTYHPTTSSRRKMTGYSFEELTAEKPYKPLLSRLKKTGGRNHRGIITCRHHGGGARLLYRLTDFKQEKNFGIPGQVEGIEYDPIRSAYLMLVKYRNGDRRYLLAPHGIKVGQELVSGEKTKARIGNRMMLQHIPLGFEIFNLELQAGKGGQAVRSAGTSAKLLNIEGDFAQVEMPSKEIRMVSKNCYASIGRLSNIDHNLINLGKAGRKRWMGRRPEVRGKVMNPCDHPHGGGEGKNPIGLKYPKTPWGAHALGVLTRNRKKKSNRLIIKNRRGRILIKT